MAAVITRSGYAMSSMGHTLRKSPETPRGLGRQIHRARCGIGARSIHGKSARQASSVDAGAQVIGIEKDRIILTWPAAASRRQMPVIVTRRNRQRAGRDIRRVNE